MTKDFNIANSLSDLITVLVVTLIDIDTIVKIIFASIVICFTVYAKVLDIKNKKVDKKNKDLDSELKLIDKKIKLKELAKLDD